LALATPEFHSCNGKFLKRLLNYDVGMGCEVVPPSSEVILSLGTLETVIVCSSPALLESNSPSSRMRAFRPRHCQIRSLLRPLELFMENLFVWKLGI
jgi:hypothetical protein